MNQRGFSSMVLAFAMAGLAAVGIAQGSIAGTAGWKTYTNRSFGFQFKYPPNGRVEVDGPFTTQSGTQPSNLGEIRERGGSSQMTIQVFSPDIVEADGSWPERPCGEWTFGVDDRPLSSEQTSFAGQETLHVVSRNYRSVASDFYCINYRPNPVVIMVDQPPSSETRRILSSFRFLEIR